MAMENVDSVVAFLGDTFTTLRLTEINGETFDVFMICLLTSAQEVEVTLLDADGSIIETVILLLHAKL